jgi:hypothetical protein
MKFSIFTTAVLLSPALAAPLESGDIIVTRSEANASTNAALALLERDEVCLYTGFSGAGCTGTMGDWITYDQRCIYARGSTSFYTTAGCPRMFIGLYEHKKCENGYNVFLTVDPGTCHDVNTGHAWLSTSWTAV